jgi:hypothetical protein
MKESARATLSSAFILARFVILDLWTRFFLDSGMTHDLEFFLLL